MPYNELQGFGNIKPPVGTSLSTAPPWRNLVGYWMFNEGGGQPFDCLSAKKGTLSGVTWGKSQKGGAAINYAVNTDYVDTGEFASYTWLNSGTIAWRLKPSFAFNDGVQHYMWGQLNSGANPEFSAQKFTDSRFYVGWVTSGGTDQRVNGLMTASTFAQNQTNDYVFTWGPNGSVIYRNGISLATNVTAPTAQSPTQTMMIGRANGTASTSTGFASGTIDWWFALNGYCMKPADVLSLFQHPFQMFVPSQRRIISQVPSVGGFNAAWARQPSYVIGGGLY